MSVKVLIFNTWMLKNCEGYSTELKLWCATNVSVKHTGPQYVTF